MLAAVIDKKPTASIRLHANDNVLIARVAMRLGQEMPELGLRMRAQVPAGHKIAAGDHVHAHNLEPIELDRDPGFCQVVRPIDFVPQAERATFMGIVREDGHVATRNFIGILASVNCSSTVITQIAQYVAPERLKDFPNVDGVVACAQTTGCGMPSPSEHFDVLRRTSAGYARDDRRRHQGCAGDAAESERGRTRASRPATSRSASNAAARTASPALPQILHRAQRWTSWCATAAPRSCRRRRNFKVSNTCRRAAR